MKASPWKNYNHAQRSSHGMVVLLYNPISLIEPNYFNGVLVFADHLFRGEVFD